MADYTLYLVTDRHMAKSGTVEEIVEKAIAGGCTMVQLREKEGDTGELLERALRVKAVTEKYHVPLIIDDRIDVMMAAGADGVHVGQSDMPAAIARKMIGSEKILGVSAGTLEEALKAEQDGADYLGVGAMYQTATKTDADLTTMETLKEIKNGFTYLLLPSGELMAGQFLILKEQELMDLLLPQPLWQRMIRKRRL